MRASDLYLGVIRLTMASESTNASSVGIMIARFLRSSACQMTRTSRSPVCGETGSGDAGTGADTAFETAVLSTRRPNPNRITCSRLPLDVPTGRASGRAYRTGPRDGTQRLQSDYGCHRVNSTGAVADAAEAGPRTDYALLTTKALNWI